MAIAVSARAAPRAGSAPASRQHDAGDGRARGHDGDRHGDVAQQDATEGTAQEHARGARPIDLHAQRLEQRARCDVAAQGGDCRGCGAVGCRDGDGRRATGQRGAAQRALRRAQRGRRIAPRDRELGVARRTQAARGTPARGSRRAPQRQAGGAGVESPRRRHRSAARLGAHGVALGRAVLEAAGGGHDGEGGDARQQREREQRRRGRAGHGLQRPAPRPRPQHDPAPGRARARHGDEPGPEGERGREREADRPRPARRALNAPRAGHAEDAEQGHAGHEPDRPARVDPASLPGQAHDGHAGDDGGGPRAGDQAAREGPRRQHAAPQRRAEQEGHVGRSEDDRPLPRPPARDRDEADERDGRPPLADRAGREHRAEGLAGRPVEQRAEDAGGDGHHVGRVQALAQRRPWTAHAPPGAHGGDVRVGCQDAHPVAHPLAAASLATSA